MTGIDILAAGAFGGLSNEVLHWYGLRRSPALPAYLKSVFYWFITLLMICIGAFAAHLQLKGSGDTFLAFQIGLSIPLILKKLSTAMPEPTGSMNVADDKSASLKGFLKG